MFEVFNTQTGETVGYVETEWEALWESRTKDGSFDYEEDTVPSGNCSHSWLGMCDFCLVSLLCKE